MVSSARLWIWRAPHLPAYGRKHRTPPPLYPKLSTPGGALEVLSNSPLLSARSYSFAANHGAEVSPFLPTGFCKGQKSNRRHGQHNQHIDFDDFRSAAILSHEHTHKSPGLLLLVTRADTPSSLATVIAKPTWRLVFDFQTAGMVVDPISSSPSFHAPVTVHDDTSDRSRSSKDHRPPITTRTKPRDTGDRSCWFEQASRASNLG